MSEEDFEPTEQAEAEALARALERGSAADELPEDALEAAALLRYSVDAGALQTDREDAVLAEVLEAAERAAARRPAERARPWWALALGFAGLTVAAALMLFWVVRGPRPTPVPESSVPAPSAALLSLSLDRIEAPERDAEFDREMRTYRARLYDSLSERYDGR